MTEDPPIQVSPGSDVFVSYASHDKAVADAVCEALERAGIKCWIAPRDVIPGAHYADEIILAITGAKALVVVLSDSALASKHVGKEIERASSKGRPIIALRTSTAPLPPAFEYFLSESQWIDVGIGGVSAVASRLVQAVRSHLDPSVAGEWRSKPGSPVATQGITPRRKRWMLASCVAALTIAIGYFVANKFWHSNHHATQRPVASAPTAAIPDKSIAVLPFVDMSEKKDQEYFSDGLSEELIDRLSKVHDLRVPARTSSFYFKGKQITIAEIAKALGVAHVLEGSVRRSGGKLRVTAQLIEASTGYHLWSETYDRSGGDIFKLQDDLAVAVVKALKVSLLPTAAISVPTNPDAYALLLQARYYGARNWDEEYERKQRNAINQALRLDPSFAMAWAALSENLTMEGSAQVPASRERYRQQAIEAANKASVLNPTIAEPHLALSRIAFWFDWNWTASQIELRRALELEPTNTGALAWAAYVAATLGRQQEALRMQLQVTNRDPLNPKEQFFLGEAYLIAARYPEAEAAFGKARDLNSSQGLYYWNLALIALLRGNAPAALTAIRGEQEAPYQAAGLALAYYSLGRRLDSDVAMVNAEAKLGVDDPFDVACAHAFRGEPDQAFQWLERAYQVRQPQLVYLLRQPLLAKVRGDPRWKVFLRKMNLPE